jgi:hypothetical protein
LVQIQNCRGAFYRHFTVLANILLNVVTPPDIRCPVCGQRIHARISVAPCTVHPPSESKATCDPQTLLRLVLESIKLVLRMHPTWNTPRSGQEVVVKMNAGWHPREQQVTKESTQIHTAQTNRHKYECAPAGANSRPKHRAQERESTGHCYQLPATAIHSPPTSNRQLLPSEHLLPSVNRQQSCSLKSLFRPPSPPQKRRKICPVCSTVSTCSK